MNVGLKLGAAAQSRQRQDALTPKYERRKNMEHNFDISFSDCMKRKHETRSVEAITAPMGLPLFVLAFTNLLMDTADYRRSVFRAGVNPGLLG